MLAGLVLVCGELDAAGLAAAADQHLCLDDDGVSDLRGGDGVLDGRDGVAVRDVEAVSREELLALVFEQVHSGAGL